jgi:hypothetical protein
VKAWLLPLLLAAGGCVTPGPRIPVVTQVDLLRMSEAGLSDALIIRTLDASEVDVDVSSRNLVALFERGLSTDILEALVDRVARGRRLPVETARQRQDPALWEWEDRPTEVGGRRQDGPDP